MLLLIIIPQNRQKSNPDKSSCSSCFAERFTNKTICSILKEYKLQRQEAKLEHKEIENYEDIKERRRKADLKRRKKDMKILCIVIFIVLLIVIALIFAFKGDDESIPASASVSEETTTTTASTTQNDDTTDTTEATTEQTAHVTEVIDGRTYIDGILIVNKTYSLPSDYDPGMDEEAMAAFEQMQAAASDDGLFLYIRSGYRSYADQEYQYNVHVENKGKEYADEVSARPGYSEHQTGLCMDVNSTEDSFAETEEAKWLAEHCAEYGFIIRFPEGKEDITGYNYESWHIRYVGVEVAKEITESGLCLEEYLGVTSEYAD